MNKMLVSVTATILALPALAAAQTVVPPVTVSGATSAEASIPSGVSASVTSAASAVPSVVAPGSTSAAPALLPVTTSSVTSAGATVSSGGGSGSTVSGGASFSGGSSGSAGLSTASTTIPSAFATTSCLLISSAVLKMGVANDPNDVGKLQAFLSDSEHIDVAVTGVFDAETEAAVKTFQTKYATDILAPWGTTQPSGVASITTLKKVEQLACSQPLTMTPDELSKISSYKAESLSGSSTGSTTVGANGLGSTTPLAPEVGQNGDQNANIAAVGGASILVRFWNFIKSLF